MFIFVEKLKKASKLMRLKLDPHWNDYDLLTELWGPLDKDAAERLGTCDEASETMSELREVFACWGSDVKYECDKLSHIEKHLTKWQGPGAVLGHTNRVSWLGYDSISLGYVVKKHAHGYELERFETCEYGILVLRFRGKIIVTCPLHFIRSEIRGRIHMD